jgi:hypothetical protein
LALQYKVVELSPVDERALEQALNTWVSEGWMLDTVQFAMRESSRRPAMAFVVFCRSGAPSVESERHRRALALERLRELAGVGA